MSIPKQFVERWQEAWRRMDPEFWTTIYHPEGTLLQPGMERPLRRAEMPDHITRMNAILPDIRCRMKNWAWKDSTVFTEWQITAKFAGEPLEWEGADRFTLLGEDAIEEVVYFDTLPLWARLDPSMKRSSLLEVVPVQPGDSSLSREYVEGPTSESPVERFVERYKVAWGERNPSLFDLLYHQEWSGQTPATGGLINRGQLSDYYARVFAAMPDFHEEVERWASNRNVVFLEWTISGTFGGQPMAWKGIDRHTLRGDQSIHGVSYFDTLPLWARLDPSMKRGFLLGAATATREGDLELGRQVPR